MAFVIVEGCIKDELCVQACPTDCIHPKSVDGEFEAAKQLYVDPEGCIDCGACIPVCPNNTIFSAEDLPADMQAFAARNAAFYSGRAGGERGENWLE